MHQIKVKPPALVGLFLYKPDPGSVNQEVTRWVWLDLSLGGAPLAPSALPRNFWKGRTILKSSAAMAMSGVSEWKCLKW